MTTLDTRGQIELGTKAQILIHLNKGWPSLVQHSEDLRLVLPCWLPHYWSPLAWVPCHWPSTAPYLVSLPLAQHGSPPTTPGPSRVPCGDCLTTTGPAASGCCLRYLAAAAIWGFPAGVHSPALLLGLSLLLLGIPAAWSTQSCCHGGLLCCNRGFLGWGSSSLAVA